jgi:hypothetical protein
MRSSIDRSVSFWRAYLGSTPFQNSPEPAFRFGVLVDPVVPVRGLVRHSPAAPTRYENECIPLWPTWDLNAIKRSTAVTEFLVNDVMRSARLSNVDRGSKRMDGKET